MVICLERGADLYIAQLMPLPLTVSCSSRIQIGFTFLVPAHLGSPGKRAIKRVCVCVSVDYLIRIYTEVPFVLFSRPIYRPTLILIFICQVVRVQQKIDCLAEICPSL